MRKLVIVAWTALLASPGMASTDTSDLGASFGAPVDMLYPEIAVDDDGWRGLLPIILYNTDELANRPKPTTASDRRSERDGED